MVSVYDPDVNEPDGSALANLVEIVVQEYGKKHPTNLFQRSEFWYVREQQVAVCPAGETLYRETQITKSQGTRYIFEKDKCEVKAALLVRYEIERITK